MARRCSICKEKHESKGIANVCESFECRVAFAERAAAKSKAKRESDSRRQSMEAKRADKERLARLKPGYLEAKAQDAVNEYVRLRDIDQPCISCGKPAHSPIKWDAGHFKSRGANSFLRFHLWNLNRQCVSCNQHKSGNVAEYERGIAARFGQERLDYLNTAPRLRRYSDEYLIRIAAIFRKKTRMLKKRKGIQ